ncbi:MAG: hypothetical protein H6839_10350 [Planctomycetes bacterium]|nr:hypothetical protein [Planctomycetota bacterium]
MINAGGRWAVLPSGAAALLAIVLALAGAESLAWFLPLSLIALAGSVLALLLTRRSYARPAAAGAPDWTLLLDRALGLNDALPTWLESKGEFRLAMEAGIAQRLDPKLEKKAAPARHWGALAIVLVLALMPLAFWRPAPDEPTTPPQVARNETPPETEASKSGDGPGQAGGGGEEGEGEGESAGDNGGNGGKGEEGEVQKRPDGAKSDSGVGDPPPDAQPQPTDGNPPPKEGGVGDKKGDPTPPPAQPDKDVDSNLNHVKPEAGEGDTRTEDRSRWVYNPNAGKLDGSTPGEPDVQHPGERAVPRTKVTTRERELIENLYKKLKE